MTWPKSCDTDVMAFLDLCRRVAARMRIRTRYTRALEDEVARLRAENHALVNSILGVAGIAPLRMVAANPGKASRQPDTKRPAGRELQKSGANRPAGSFESQDKRELQVPGEIAVPLRRRSWQQIERAREIEDARAARRERETDTEAFPTPRNVVPRV
jgi:hypothetical protein